MAGQKAYSTNVLSTARGALLLSANFQINGALGTTGTRVLNGRMFSIVSVSSTAGGTNNAITIQLPEKYSNLEGVNVQVVRVSATSPIVASIASAYNPTTGQITLDVGTNNGTTWAGSTSPNVQIQFSAVVGLG